MMCLGEPKLSTKFEIADFIYYGNRKKFVLKIGINQIVETLNFLEKLTVYYYTHSHNVSYSIYNLSGAVTAAKW